MKERLKLRIRKLRSGYYCKDKGFLVVAYYLLNIKTIFRELNTFLSGKNMHLHEPNGDLVVLRRNIHRLEKGLIMKPQKPVFALDYIDETVEIFERLCLNDGFTSKCEREWSESVLFNYFNTVSLNEKLKIHKKKLEQKLSISDCGKGPFLRDFSSNKLTYTELFDFVKFRRSTRWFEPKPVSRELIDKAMILASESPSACNRQPYRYHFFDDKQKVQDIASIAGGTAGFHHNFPMIAAVIGQQRAYFDERDRHVIYIDGALSAMSFVYGLESLGLSSCIINWPEVEERELKMSHQLELDKDERVIMLIAIGWPDKTAKVPYSNKKTLNVLRKFN